MPISIDEFNKLPVLTGNARVGGKKVDWNAVEDDLRDLHASVTVNEVYEIVKKHLIGDSVTRYRVKLWLDTCSEDGKCTRKYDGFRMNYLFE